MRGPNFKWNSETVGQAFWETLDTSSFPAHYYIAALLERGVRVLVYAGDTDLVCNWVRFSGPYLRGWS